MEYTVTKLIVRIAIILIIQIDFAVLKIVFHACITALIVYICS